MRSLVLVVSAGLSSASLAQPITFSDASGLIDFNRSSLASGGTGLGGAAWFDMDGDGDLDLFITNGQGQANGLFENDGNGAFTDIAQSAGVEGFGGSSGVVVGDLDNDGLTDIVLCGDGGMGGSPQTPMTVYHNLGGGLFEDISGSAGVSSAESGLSMALGDINLDGFLDLFITAPGDLSRRVQHRNKLFLNNGDLTFTDISASSGVDTDLGACATRFTDINGDGLIDLLIANCNDVFIRPTPIEVFINNGDLTFTDARTGAGVTRRGFWMGLTMADFQNDGGLDIFATNVGAPSGQPHVMYLSDLDGTFTAAGNGNGHALHEFGWGCVSDDFDNDGFADIFIVGSLPAPPFNIIGDGLGNPGTMLINDGDATFTEITDTLPINVSDRFTSGLASADFDGNGFVDLLVVTEPWNGTTGEPVLLRSAGNGNNWVQIGLEGTRSNRNAIGARVLVTSTLGSQTRELAAGSSFLSSNSPIMTFGLGQDAATDSVRVLWPSGLLETFKNLGAGEAVTLVEGTGRSCPADLDHDGDVDAEDFFRYLDRFASGDLRADIDGDGDIDAEDFFGFLDQFVATCD